MKDTQGTTSTQEMPSLGRTILFHLVLIFGLNHVGETMKMNTHLIGNLDKMRNHTSLHTMRWILFVIMTLIHFGELISFMTVIAIWKVIVIMDLTDLQGLGCVTVMSMMIMTTGPVSPIKAGRTAERENMIMVVIVMILIMTEAAEGTVAGGGMDPVTMNVIRKV